VDRGWQYFNPKFKNAISEFRIEILPASIHMLVPTTSLKKV